MAFWSSEKLKERVPADKLIMPYDEAAVKHGAYELAMGNQATVTAQSSSKGVDRKLRLNNHDPLVIPPGQFALLLTKEIVTIPSDAIGFISIRAKKKFEGLVNVSGFHVDPGFSGRLKFSVYNAGSQDILISESDRVFMLWYADLDRTTTDGYGVAGREQNEISTQDLTRMQGEVSSPAQLRRDLVELQHSVANLKWVATVLITITGGLGIGLLVKLLMPSESKPATTGPAITTPHVSQTQSASTSQSAPVISGVAPTNAPAASSGATAATLPAMRPTPNP